MPLNTNIGGQLKLITDKEAKYLTEEQAKHIYKEVELGNVNNVETIQQEIDQERELDRLGDKW